MPVLDCNLPWSAGTAALLLSAGQGSLTVLRFQQETDTGAWALAGSYDAGLQVCMSPHACINSLQTAQQSRLREGCTLIFIVCLPQGS
jgi:hypothetical protein